MKKIIISVILLTAVAGAVSAQTARPKLTEDQKKELKAQMDAYKAKLKLTPEQQPKFEEINLQFAESLAKLKDEQGRKLSKYRKLKATTSERDKQMKALLSAEQYKLFKSHQAKMKDELKSLRSN